MERIFGGILTILMFCAILWMGILRRLPMNEVLERATWCSLAAGLIGWLSFGPLGRALIQNAIQINEERPPATEKKAGT